MLFGSKVSFVHNVKDRFLPFREGSITLSLFRVLFSQLSPRLFEQIFLSSVSPPRCLNTNSLSLFIPVFS